MKIASSVLQVAGVDRAAWHRYVINPYGSQRRPPPARPRHVVLRGGPCDGFTLNAYDPQTGTLPLRGGRYVWRSVGPTWKAYGYLEWQEEGRP